MAYSAFIDSSNVNNENSDDYQDTEIEAQPLSSAERRKYSIKSKNSTKKLLKNRSGKLGNKSLTRPKSAAYLIDTKIDRPQIPKKMVYSGSSAQFREERRKKSLSKISRLSSRKNFRKDNIGSEISAIERQKTTLNTVSSCYPLTYYPKNENPKNEEILVPVDSVPQVTIDPVKSSSKQKVIDWLLAHLYCPQSTNFQKLPKKASNGLFFYDLINTIERQEVLKGRIGDNSTSIKVIFRKVMDHFREFEKFNPRYLDCEFYLINADPDVFWGFLDDIMHLYQNKISPYDQRFENSRRTETNLNSTRRSRSRGKRAIKNEKRKYRESENSDIDYLTKLESGINFAKENRDNNLQFINSGSLMYTEDTNNEGIEKKKNVVVSFQKDLKKSSKYADKYKGRTQKEKQLKQQRRS